MTTNSIVEDRAYVFKAFDFNSDEDNNVMEKVERFYSYRHVGIEFNHNEIHCAHSIGKSFIDEKQKKVRSIIIKFKSWESRTDSYKLDQRNH